MTSINGSMCTGRAGGSRPAPERRKAPTRRAVPRAARHAGGRSGGLRGKAIAIIASVALVAALAVGGTIAWLTSETESVVNTFAPSKVTTEVAETLEGAVKKDVKITNTGDVDAFIRVAVQVNWADADGNVYGKSGAPVEGADKDYTAAWNVPAEAPASGGYWFKGADGYYYWSQRVAPGGSTGALISSITPNEGRTPEGYGLQVRVMGSGIQADGTGEGGEGHPAAKAAVETAWPAVARSADGETISKAI